MAYRIIYEGIKKKIIHSDILKIGFVSGVLLCLPLLLWHIPWMRHLLGQASSWKNSSHAMMIFLFLAVPYSAIGLPKQPLCFAAGVAFGFWKGLVLMAFICEIGAMISYFLGRYYFIRHRFLREKKYSFLEKMSDFVHYTPFRAILMLRLMPIGSAFLLSVASGVMKVPFSGFMWGSLLGSLPQEIVFVLAGASSMEDRELNIIFVVILFVFSALLGIFLLRNYRRRA